MTRRLVTSSMTPHDSMTSRRHNLQSRRIRYRVNYPCGRPFKHTLSQNFVLKISSFGLEL